MSHLAQSSPSPARRARRTALLAVLPVAAVVASAATAWAAPVRSASAAPVPSTSAAPAPVAVQRVAVAPVPLTAVPGGAPTTVGPRLQAQTTATPTATFTVTYHGFSAPAKAAFARAVTTWAGTVSSKVPITVDATYQSLAPGVLGSAGPDGIYRNFPGAPKTDTYYVDALVNKYSGRNVSSRPDIVASFSSSFGNWWFGSGAAPAGKYDFQTVVTHELGHGLGFLGAGYVSGSTGTVRFEGSNGRLSPSAYDRFTENGAGKALLSYADPSAALKTQLTGRSLFFDSPAVRSANGNLRAKLYAPTTWDDGSSYSHLDEATYRAGTANSLMTPQLGTAETIRTPGPITKALLKSIGW